MLSSLRKFSGSIYAKILLGIVVIPFVFWGMGTSFTGGSKNIVVVINKEKFSNQEFADFIRRYAPSYENLNNNQIEELLSVFIGEKLIEKEIEYFDIKLTDYSLTKLIKNQKDFKRDGVFSRTEYEKFLLENNTTAVAFETALAKHEKKKQFLDFISGGVLPSKFLINATYDKNNQKRKIQLINLNEFFKNKFIFSEDQIKTHYEKNKDKYKETLKTLKFIELSPEKLIGSSDFNDLYFEKIDQIDDAIIQGQNIDFIIKNFNLSEANTVTSNTLGEDIKSKSINILPKEIINKIFKSSDLESVTLFENKEKYFVVEIIKTENVEKGLASQSVRNNIFSNLHLGAKRKFISELSGKINKNIFTKADFDKLSSNHNLTVEKIYLKTRKKHKELKKEVVEEIYTAAEKKIIIIYDLNLSENFLVYIDKIENVTIDENSNDYIKYTNLSKKDITTKLLNSYDQYIKKKYKIDINYKALTVVKNYFN